MHWRAVYFNRQRAECCFFDSLVSEPTDDVMRGKKMIMRKIDYHLYLKFKINRIKLQADNTATCGAFALRSLLICMQVRCLKKLHALLTNIQKVRSQLDDICPNGDIYKKE